VTLTARDPAALTAAAEAIRAETGQRPAIIPLDLAQPGSAEHLAATCGEADILVNNAGAIPAGRLTDIDETRWRAAWDLKLFGYINLTRAFYPKMQARRRGTIVNIIGTGGERPSAGFICGAAANAALIAFTRALGGESHRDGIRVVAINPGPVATERLVTLLQQGAGAGGGDWREGLKAMPFGRAGEAAEIAAAVAFLASEQAAYINATVLTIDGGAVNSAG
jgi:3-oxoacyl-[acyl-carrier protein] reductase